MPPTTTSRRRAVTLAVLVLVGVAVMLFLVLAVGYSRWSSSRTSVPLQGMRKNTSYTIEPTMHLPAAQSKAPMLPRHASVPTEPLFPTTWQNISSNLTLAPATTMPRADPNTSTTLFLLPRQCRSWDGPLEPVPLRRITLPVPTQRPLLQSKNGSGGVKPLISSTSHEVSRKRRVLFVGDSLIRFLHAQLCLEGTLTRLCLLHNNKVSAHHLVTAMTSLVQQEDARDPIVAGMAFQAGNVSTYSGAGAPVHPTNVTSRGPVRRRRLNHEQFFVKALHPSHFHCAAKSAEAHRKFFPTHIFVGGGVWPITIYDQPPVSVYTAVLQSLDGLLGYNNEEGSSTVDATRVGSLNATGDKPRVWLYPPHMMWSSRLHSLYRAFHDDRCAGGHRRHLHRLAWLCAFHVKNETTAAAEHARRCRTKGGHVAGLQGAVSGRRLLLFDVFDRTLADGGRDADAMGVHYYKGTMKYIGKLARTVLDARRPTDVVSTDHESDLSGVFGIDNHGACVPSDKESRHFNCSDACAAWNRRSPLRDIVDATVPWEQRSRAAGCDVTLHPRVNISRRYEPVRVSKNAKVSSIFRHVRTFASVRRLHQALREARARQQSHVDTKHDLCSVRGVSDTMKAASLRQAELNATCAASLAEFSRYFTGNCTLDESLDNPLRKYYRFVYREHFWGRMDSDDDSFNSALFRSLTRIHRAVKLGWKGTQPLSNVTPV